MEDGYDQQLSPCFGIEQAIGTDIALLHIEFFQVAVKALNFDVIHPQLSRYLRSTVIL